MCLANLTAGLLHLLGLCLSGALSVGEGTLPARDRMPPKRAATTQGIGRRWVAGVQGGVRGPPKLVREPFSKLVPPILGDMSIALRQIGPKSAFLTNRIGNAYARHPPAPSRSLVRKKSARTHNFAKVHLKLAKAEPAASPKTAPSPTPDTTDQPGHRSPSCGPPQHDEEGLIPVEARDDDKALAVMERGLVPTAPASLAPEAAPDEATERRFALTLKANNELERTTAADEIASPSTRP